MGMYTEFFFRAELRKKGNLETIQILAELFADPQEIPKDLPDHWFFAEERWHPLLFGSSAYFPSTPVSKFEVRSWSPADDYYELGIHSSFKHYGNEIEGFLDWINPATTEPAGTFIGYSLYEEKAVPDLYYIREKK